MLYIVIMRIIVPLEFIGILLGNIFFGVRCWVAHHRSCCLFAFQNIMISGAPNPEEISNTVKRANENHLANRLRYSLRVNII